MRWKIWVFVQFDAFQVLLGATSKQVLTLRKSTFYVVLAIESRIIVFLVREAIQLGLDEFDTSKIGHVPAPMKRQHRTWDYAHAQVLKRHVWAAKHGGPF